jgi:hypothetical protein
MDQCRKTGKDLCAIFPKPDEWGVKYPLCRKPNYQDSLFWDTFDWLTDEQTMTAKIEGNSMSSLHSKKTPI